MATIAGEIRETVASILSEVRAINARLDKINGRIGNIEDKAALHDTQIALLEAANCNERGVWDKVWDIAQPLIVAALTWLVASAAK